MNSKKINNLPLIVKRPTFYRPVSLLWLILLLVACRTGGTQPTPFAPTVSPTRPQPTPTLTMTPSPEPLSPYENLEAGITISLPAGWEIGERLHTLLGDQYLFGPQPLTPGPSTSILFVADASQLTPTQAAQQLQCGGDCPNPIIFEEVLVGEQTAQKTTIVSPNTAALEWYFVQHAGRLIYFTIHDPQTLATRHDLLATLQFIPPQIAVLDPTITPTPTITPMPTLTPTPIVIDRVLAWRRIVLDEAGLKFESPAGWQESNSGQDWLFDPAGNIGLHFAWQEIDEGWQLIDWLPQQGLGLVSTPLDLPWASQTISYTEQISATWQAGILIQTDSLAYHFSITAPSLAVLAMLRPVLDHTYTTTQLTYTNDIYIDSAIDGTVSFFHELLFDATGNKARLYLTAQLRGSLASNQNPISLLQLDQRFTQYELILESATTTTVSLIANLTLEDNTIVQRRLTVIFQEDNGWHINNITLVE